MGPVAIIGAALGVAQSVSQRRQAKKAERAQNEGREISAASEQVQNQLARRRAARELRINRARLMASSESSGVTASSGQLGADGAMGSNFGAAVAQQAFATKTANGLSSVNQRIATAESRSASIGAWGQTFNTVLNSGIFSDPTKKDGQP